MQHFQDAEALDQLKLLFCTTERLERVPWIAPECIDGVESSRSDQWSFGATFLEICYSGNLPIITSAEVFTLSLTATFSNIGLSFTNYNE